MKSSTNCTSASFELGSLNSEICLRVENICLRFETYLLESWNIFAWELTNICCRFQKYLFEVEKYLVGGLTSICLRVEKYALLDWKWGLWSLHQLGKKESKFSKFFSNDFSQNSVLISMMKWKCICNKYQHQKNQRGYIADIWTPMSCTIGALINTTRLQYPTYKYPPSWSSPYHSPNPHQVITCPVFLFQEAVW